MSDAVQPAVEIVEVSPRDGLQNEQRVLHTQDKRSLVMALLASGVRRLEVASFVNPKRVPQMAGAEELLAALPPTGGVRLIGLVLNQRGAQRAVRTPIHEVNFVVPATDSFGSANQGMTTDASLAELAEVAAVVRDRGLGLSVTVAVAFGCPYDGDVPHRRVIEVVERVLAWAPDEIALADTIGCGVPSQVADRFAAVAAMTDLPLRAHFHDTRRTGLANVEAAYAAGVRIFDSSAAGLGGCPFAPGASGNVATEDLVWMLDRSGRPTGVAIPEVLRAGAQVTAALGVATRSGVAVGGVFPRDPAAG